MTKEKLPPLTNEEIRTNLLQLSRGFLTLTLTMAALESLLLEKGLVTKSEIDAATAQATAQGEEAAAKWLLGAIHPGPGTGIQ